MASATVIAPLERLDKDLRALRRLLEHAHTPYQQAKVWHRINVLLEDRHALTTGAGRG